MCTNKDIEHELVEQIFQEKHYRDETGRFVVEIPINPNLEELGSKKMYLPKNSSKTMEFTAYFLERK